MQLRCLPTLATLLLTAMVGGAALAVRAEESAAPRIASASKGSAAVASSRDWPVFRGDASSMGVARTTLPEKPQLLWQKKLDKGAFDASAIILDGVVYIGDRDGILRAYALRDGAELWKFKAELGFLAAPAYKDGRVYIGDLDGQFYCVDAKTGKQLWKYKTEAEIDSSANFFGDNVLFGSQDSTLYCLSPTGKLVWKHAIDDQIRCSPTVVANRAFLAGCDGKLHVIDLVNGKEIATVPIDAPTGSTPSAMGDVVYFGTEGGTLFAIDWKKAKVVWQFQDKVRPQSIRSSAAVTPTRIVYGSRDNKIRALDPNTGKPVWTFPARRRVDSSPVIVGERAFVGVADGRLLALDLKSGQKVWEYEAGGSFDASPAVAAERLVIGNQDGTLYCFGKKD